MKRLPLFDNSDTSTVISQRKFGKALQCQKRRSTMMFTIKGYDICIANKLSKLLILNGFR